MDIIQVITRELNVEKWQVEAAVKLIDEGCTIPFISRYRKEATGTLNDEQLRNLNERLTYLRNLEDKKAQVLGSIEEQGKLTPELKKQIEAAQTLVVVEDLYRPYRPKRRTRAMIAKEKGLEPLAALITLQKAEKPIEVYAEEYVNPEKEVKSGRAYLVIVADDASDNTKKKFQNMCDFYQVPIYFYKDKDTLGHAMGKEFRASLVILDEGFAKGIRKHIDTENQTIA